MQLAPSLRLVLAHAKPLAESHGHRQVETLHVLYAMLASGPLHGLLLQTDTSPEEVRRHITDRWGKKVDGTGAISSSLATILQDCDTEIDFLRRAHKDSDAAAALKAADLTAKTISLAFPLHNQDPSLGRDLTALAQQQQLDPVIGRTDETQHALRILSRRRKNNPVLIGDPGVGKTTIAEGIAQRLVTGHVPPCLHGRRLISVEITDLVAGTSHRGSFEERMQSLIKESIEHRHILFIDEIHLVLGAGRVQGALDAANILKPALARGDILLIGATTDKEYRRYIETDGALERRFAPVFVSEASASDTLSILGSLRSHYEEHHQVTIADEALYAAIELSGRYLHKRTYPDKALDVLDDACASSYQSIRSSSDAPLGSFLAGATADIPNDPHPERSSVARDPLLRSASIQERIDTCRASLTTTTDATARAFISAVIIPTLEEELEQALSLEQRHSSIIDAHHVREVISSRTGIPLENLATSDTDLRAHILQTASDHGVDDVITPHVELFTGTHCPSLCLRQSDATCVDFISALSRITGRQLVTIDLSSYAESHALSRLIGTPPGYVGHDVAEGLLVKLLSKDPFVTLFFSGYSAAAPSVQACVEQLARQHTVEDARTSTTIQATVTCVVIGTETATDSLPDLIQLTSTEESAA